MTSPAEQRVAAAPTRGQRPSLRAVPPPGPPPAGLVPAGPSLAEAAGAALVLGGTVALWAAFLAAVS